MSSRFLLKNISRYVDLEEEDAEQVHSILRPRHLSKREFLSQPGETCKYQSYVVKGSLRSYFIGTDGSEHTIQFAIEDWFISDFRSYIEQSPGSLHIEALEDCELLQLSYEDTEQLCSSNAKFEHFFRIVAQKSFAFAQARILSNIGKTAEERYLEFNTMYPEIVQRVPQYALASYLGMSPEFLSKVRKRVALKG